MTTMETAARNRERLLRDYLDYRRSAVAEGERAAVREYLVPPGSRPVPRRGLRPRAGRARHRGAAGRTARRRRHAHVAGPHAGHSSRAADLPAAAQPDGAGHPHGRRVPEGAGTATPETPGRPDLRRDGLEPAAAVRRRRRDKRQADDGEDRAAWRAGPAAAAVRPRPRRPTCCRGAAARPRRSSNCCSRVCVSAAPDAPFTIGRPHVRRRHRHRPGGRQHARTRSRSSATWRRGGARRSCALDSTWVDDGMSLGSSDATLIKTPRVLLAWDTPASSESAGWARFWLERQFGQPVTAVRAASLRYVDLRRYNVLVLPSGTYGAVRRGRRAPAEGLDLERRRPRSRWRRRRAGRRPSRRACSRRRRNRGTARRCGQGRQERTRQKADADRRRSTTKRRSCPRKKSPKPFPARCCA